MCPGIAKHASYNTIERHVGLHAITIARMRDATVLRIATMAAATDIEEEEDEEPRIKRLDRGWLKRRK